MVRLLWTFDIEMESDRKERRKMRYTRIIAILCVAFLLVFAYGCGRGVEDAETAEHTHPLI